MLLIIIGTGLFFMLKSKPVQQPEPAPIEQKAVEQSPVLVQSNVADEEIVEEVVETAPMADKVVTANVSQKDNKAKEESPAESEISEQEKPENTDVPMELTLTDSTKTTSSLP